MTTKKKIVSNASASSTPKAATSSSSSTPVTTNAGLASLVTELTSFLDTAETRLGPAPTVSTAAQKRRVAKPRKGSDKALSLLAPIVQQHGLESSSLNVTDMMDMNQKAQTLVPLQTRLAKLTKRVGDEAFDAQTGAWDIGLQFYSLLQRRSKNDGELATNLQPIGQMFAYRHPSTTATKPTKTQTRAKAELKKAVTFATKQGVAADVLPGTTSPPSASTPVAAAPPSSSPAPVAVTPVVTSAAPAAPGTVAPSSATQPAAVTNGAVVPSH